MDGSIMVCMQYNSELNIGAWTPTFGSEYWRSDARLPGAPSAPAFAGLHCRHRRSAGRTPHGIVRRSHLFIQRPSLLILERTAEVQLWM